MAAVQDDLRALGVAISQCPSGLDRDYLEIVPPKGVAVDRRVFETEWFHTDRRLPDSHHSDALLPEPELPEKGPRTGN